VLKIQEWGEKMKKVIKLLGETSEILNATYTSPNLKRVVIEHHCVEHHCSRPLGENKM
jgi:hypothetical protein